MIEIDNFKKPVQKLENPFLNAVNGIKPPYGFTPSGMLRPKELQPPPMFGPRGSTIPPKFLPSYVKNFKGHNNNKWNQNKTQEFNNRGADSKKLYCETCDREFQSRHKFEEHKKDHVRCNVTGCMFKGHPQSLERHIEQQHTSGLFDKIKNLNTPAEIEKWRAERKSRYPTQRNVELRQRAQEERLKRGEKLSKNNSRFARKGDRERNIKGHKNQRNPPGPKFRNNRRTNSKPIGKPIELVVHSDEEDETMNGNLKRFTGTSQLSDYEIQNKVPSSQNPLSMFLGMYGSSDEEVDEPEEGEVTDDEQSPSPQQIEHAPREIIQPHVVKIESDLDEGLSSGEEPEEIKIERPNEELSTEVLKPAGIPNQRKRKRKNSNSLKPIAVKKSKSLLDNPRLRCSNQNTMLAKLLEPEIRHERNILLQCVRYVVENNFFGIGDENKT